MENTVWLVYNNPDAMTEYVERIEESSDDDGL